MATREQLLTALRNADQAGDEVAARRLAQMLNDSKPEKKSTASKVLQGVKEGAAGAVEGVAGLATGAVEGVGQLADLVSSGGRSNRFQQALSGPDRALKRFTAGDPNSKSRLAGQVLGGSALGGIPGLMKGGAAMAPQMVRQGLPAALGAAGGAVAATEVAPDSALAPLAGVMLGSMTPAAVQKSPDLVRSILAGGRGARQAAQQNIAARTRQGLPVDIGSVTKGGTASTLQGTTLGLPGTVGLTRQQTENIAKAAQKRLHEFTGSEKTGASRAGRIFRGGYGKWVKSKQKEFNTAYNILDGRIAPDTPVSMANTRKAFDDFFALFDDNPELANAWFSGGAKLQAMAKSLRSATVKEIDNKIELPKGVADTRAQTMEVPVTYDLLRGMRTEVGRMLSNRQLMMEADSARVAQIYRGLSDDMVAAAKQTGGPSLVKDVKDLNRKYRVFAERGRLAAKKFIGQKGRTDKQIYNAIFGGSEPDIQSVKRALNTLPKDGTHRQELIGIFLNRMGQPRGSEAGQLSGIGFNPQSFITRWNNAFSKNQELKNLLFNATPRLRRYAKDLDEMAHQIDDINAQAAVLANPSGTGAKGLGLWTVYTVLGAVASGNLAGTLGSVGTAAGGGYGMAKLMTSPKFVNWAVKTKDVSLPAMPGHVARLQSVMANDPDFEEEMEQFMSRLKPALRQVQQ